MSFPSIQAKEIESGKFLMRLSFKKRELMGANARSVGLMGVHPVDISDLVAAVLQEAHQLTPEDGPAPKGPLGRKVENALKKK